MAPTSWTQQAIDRFFEARKHPTQNQCDQIARTISNASNVSNVDAPGSMSYTVICKGAQVVQQGVVVSFREPEAHLDQNMIKLARDIHGELAPEVSHYGMVDGADPPLSIYIMPCLPGIPYLDALAYEVEMDEATEARHTCFVRHLARYFARCWAKPQYVTAEARAENLERIQQRLNLLMESRSTVNDSVVTELQNSLPKLFAFDYPQVLTHGEFSITNILVDENTFQIRGIVDWSLAAILPFGMELDCLFLMTGYMDLGGWHDYGCRSRLHEVFWGEFWSMSRIRDDGRRDEVRTIAERAARIGAVLRYAFQRNTDGSPSEALASDGATTWRYLQAWFAT